MDLMPRRYIMRKDIQVAAIDTDGRVASASDKAPFLIQADAFDKWEESRETDVNRTNLRVLRRLLGLGPRDTKQALRQIHYASLYDTFWVKEENSQLAWEDVRFTSNPLFFHALCGADVTEATPFASPEHSNIGSYEKGWKLTEGKWYLYKQGTPEELWSEIFSTALLRLYMGDKVVKYWRNGAYSVCENFINQDNDECLEHYYAFGYDNADENAVLSTFRQKGMDALIPDVQTMWYADALVQNGDRHAFNFGVVTSEAPPKLAPLYDWNLSMVAYRYPASYTRHEDALIRAVKGFDVASPFVVKESDIRDVYKHITPGLPIQSTEDEIVNFILSAQELLRG